MFKEEHGNSVVKCQSRDPELESHHCHFKTWKISFTPNTGRYFFYYGVYARGSMYEFHLRPRGSNGAVKVRLRVVV